MKITELKNRINLKTLNFVLLAIATAGIYTYIYLFKTNTDMEDILEQKILDQSVIIIAIALYGWGDFFVVVGPEVLGFILQISGFIIVLVWAFKSRKAIQNVMLHDHKIDYKMNTFYTFIFNIYYINYCINELEEEVEKSKVLSDNDLPPKTEPVKDNEISS